MRADFNAVLNREFLSIQSEDYSSPRRALVFNLHEDSRRSGRDLFINRTYSIQMKKSDELFAPIIQEMDASEITGGMMYFTTGLISFPENTELLLRVTKGNVLMDRILSPNEYQLTRFGNQTQVYLSLSSILGADYSGSELGIELKLRVPQNLILNRNQFSRFERTKSVSRIWN
ncbi:MAG: hypothetical protein ACJAT2_002107 [Bacteriovoracaceae bacterium]|jgi:hypothetical protein